AIDEVIRLADTMVLIADGNVVATGGVEELMGRLDLSPHTGRFEAGAVLSATVSGRDVGFGLCELSVAGKRLLVPGLDLPEDTSLRLRVRARDVSLSLTPPTGISVLNVLEGVVREINTGDGPQADVLLDIGAPLIARVTRRSVHDLDLRPGKVVHALIKAVAIDRHSVGHPGRVHDG
ncbi:MAG: TOBE domain-containing protein, partial [Rhodospirillales bacterium]|nr:TOBE domain-containing protein [Rhodospirillales bacterium]